MTDASVSRISNYSGSLRHLVIVQQLATLQAVIYQSGVDMLAATTRSGPIFSTHPMSLLSTQRSFGHSHATYSRSMASQERDFLEENRVTDRLYSFSKANPGRPTMAAACIPFRRVREYNAIESMVTCSCRSRNIM